MSTLYREHPEQHLVEIVVKGKVTKEEMLDIMPKLEAFIDSQPGKINVLEVIEDYDGFDWSVLPKGMQFDMKHMKDYGRCAVVSDSGWIGPLARIAGSVMTCEVRSFRRDELTAAKAWLQAA